MTRFRTALCIFALLIGWIAVASYVVLTGPTLSERDKCSEQYKRGQTCLIVRKMAE